MRFWDWLEEKDTDAAPVELVLPDGDEIIRQRVRFYGQVQGVGFRFTIQMAARDHLVTGYARNEADGSVLAELQGYPKNLRRVVRDIQSHSRFIRIDRIENEPIEVDVREGDFKTS